MQKLFKLYELETSPRKPQIARTDKNDKSGNFGYGDQSYDKPGDISEFNILVEEIGPNSQNYKQPPYRKSSTKLSEQKTSDQEPPFSVNKLAKNNLIPQNHNTYDQNYLKYQINPDQFGQGNSGSTQYHYHQYNNNYDWSKQYPETTINTQNNNVYVNDQNHNNKETFKIYGKKMLHDKHSEKENINQALPIQKLEEGYQSVYPLQIDPFNDY